MRITVFLIISLSSLMGWGQNISVSVSKNPVLIGEPFEIQFKTIAKNQNIESKIQWDTIPIRLKNKTGIFELVQNKFEVDTFNTSINKNTEWIGTVKALVWDSGTFVFPRIPFKIGENIVYSDSILIEGQLEKKIPGVDLYEIRESFVDIKAEEEKAKKEEENKNRWFYAVILISVLIVFLIILLMIRRVRKKKQEQIKKELSLMERALLAIDELEKLQLWKQNRHKEHFVELSFILRSYLSTCYNLNLLEKTTKESLILLKQCNVSVSHLLQIEFVLNHADMVKFAKSVLEEEYILNLDDQARSCVRNSKSTS